MNFEKNILDNGIERGANSDVEGAEAIDRKEAGGMSGKFWGKYKERAKGLARIAYLGGALGLASIGGTEYLKNSEAYKTHIEAESAAERGKYEEFKKEILEKIGEEAIKRIEDADRVAYLRRTLNPEKPKIPTSGFEEVGISSQKLSEMWTEENGFYPADWIKNINSIRYVTGNIKKPDYGENFKNLKAAANNDSFGYVEFSGSSFWGENTRSVVKNMDYVFAHELGHSNDWESPQNLSRAERAELLLLVVERMNSRDHFRTLMEEVTNGKSYHSLIDIEDKTEEAIARAKEHFAIMTEGYFGHPDEMRADHPEDFKIIDNLVNSGGGAFVPENASAKREIFINESFADSAKK